MTGYLARRLLQAAVTVWLVVTIVFVMLHTMPGSPARVILGPREYPAEVAAFNRVNGIGLPLPVQYGRFLAALVTTGQLTFAAPAAHSPYDIVNGYAYSTSLAQLVTGPVANTLLLVGLAMLVSIPVGLALGALAATTRGPQWIASAMTIFGHAAYAIPVFVTGVILVQLLAFDVPALPFNNPGWTVGDVLAEPAGLVLPVLTLAVSTTALIARYTRSSVADCLTSDYVTTARSLGASRWRVLRRHVARNAAIPVVTVLATRVPAILGIEVPLEVFFGYPGIGELAWTAATGKLAYTLLGAVLIVGVLVVLATLAADIVYLIVDPRIRYSDAPG